MADINIYGTLKNVTNDPIVYSEQVKDSSLNKFQSEINESIINNVVYNRNNATIDLKHDDKLISQIDVTEFPLNNTTTTVEIDSNIPTYNIYDYIYKNGSHYGELMGKGIYTVDDGVPVSLYRYVFGVDETLGTPIVENLEHGMTDSLVIIDYDVQDSSYTTTYYVFVGNATDGFSFLASLETDTGDVIPEWIERIFSTGYVTGDYVNKQLATKASKTELANLTVEITDYMPNGSKAELPMPKKGIYTYNGVNVTHYRIYNNNIRELWFCVEHSNSYGTIYIEFDEESNGWIYQQLIEEGNTTDEQEELLKNHVYFLFNELNEVKADNAQLSVLNKKPNLGAFLDLFEGEEITEPMYSETELNRYFALKDKDTKNPYIVLGSNEEKYEYSFRGGEFILKFDHEVKPYKTYTDKGYSVSMQIGKASKKYITMQMDTSETYVQVRIYRDVLAKKCLFRVTDPLVEDSRVIYEFPMYQYDNKLKIQLPDEVTKISITYKYDGHYMPVRYHEFNSYKTVHPIAFSGSSDDLENNPSRKAVFEKRDPNLPTQTGRVSSAKVDTNYLILTESEVVGSSGYGKDSYLTTIDGLSFYDYYRLNVYDISLEVVTSCTLYIFTASKYMNQYVYLKVNDNSTITIPANTRYTINVSEGDVLVFSPSDSNGSSGIFAIYAKLNEIRIPEQLSKFVNDTNYITREDIADKLDILESGTNIKTINNNSILGSGDVLVGTITGITMNGISKGTNGNVNLGNVVTSVTFNGNTQTITNGNMTLTTPTTSSVTSGSTTPITSGGVYNTLQSYAKNSDVVKKSDIDELISSFKNIENTNSTNIQAIKGYIYRINNDSEINSLNITLPTSDLIVGDTCKFYFTTVDDDIDNIKFDISGGNILKENNFEIKANTIHEVTAFYNGFCWIISVKYFTSPPLEVINCSLRYPDDSKVQYSPSDNGTLPRKINYYPGPHSAGDTDTIYFQLDFNKSIHDGNGSYNLFCQTTKADFVKDTYSNNQFDDAVNSRGYISFVLDPDAPANNHETTYITWKGSMVGSRDILVAEIYS